VADGVQRQWCVELVRIGSVPPAVMRDLRADLVLATEHPVWVSDLELDPGPAFHRRRAQYAAEKLLDALLASPPADNVKRIGVADVDLFLDLFTHVFGSALLAGGAGIASIHRLDPVFSGEPADPETLRRRLVREALHELGHTLGLVHCRVGSCAMNPSHKPEQIDIKLAGFCRLCAEKVGMPAHDP